MERRLYRKVASFAIVQNEGGREELRNMITREFLEILHVAEKLKVQTGYFSGEHFFDKMCV